MQTSICSYPRFLTCLPQTEYRAGNYAVRFAQDPDALDAILKLRFEVFNLELGEGLDSSHQTRRDEDEFDACCHHLLVRDRESGEVVGTYRMQTGEMASQGCGFYAQTEFDLSTLPGEFLEEAVELGRACIAKDHRNGRVLFLLWRGLARYLVHNRKKYFFGCCSLSTQDPAEGKRLMHYFEKQGYVHPDLQVRPQPGFVCPASDVPGDGSAPLQVPLLMRLYLDYGAKICGLPAIDRTFKTIDYLMALDGQSVDEDNLKRFL
jgi:putative hemolysin